MKAEGSWNASGRNGRFINQKRTSGQSFKFGLRIADFILSRVRSLSAAKPSHFYQGLAELQLYQGRPAALAVLSSLGGARRRARFRNFGAGSWPVASRNNFPGDGSFRDSHGKPAPSLARAPLFWRWGLARRASRNNFPGDGQSFCDSLPRARFRRFGAGGWPDGLPETSFRAMKAEGSWNASGRNGRFINQKRTSGQIFKFGLRMADFILPRVRSLSAAKPSHFYQGLAELQLYQGRLAALAVLSRSVDLGCGGRFHIAPHKQFINGQVEKAPYKASTIASYKAPRKAILYSF